MFKDIANIASLFKQAQEIGGKIETIKEQLKSERAVGNSGGGMVEAEVNGLGEVLRLTIDQALVDGGEREMIEDLVPAAINQAVAKAREKHAEAMKTVTGGLNIPGIEGALDKLLGDGGDNPLS